MQITTYDMKDMIYKRIKKATEYIESDQFSHAHTFFTDVTDMLTLMCKAGHDQASDLKRKTVIEATSEKLEEFLVEEGAAGDGRQLDLGDK